MQRLLILILLSTILSLCPGRVFSCTAVVVDSKNGPLLAKNLDWPISSGYFILNQPGTFKKALVGDNRGLQWRSKYCSVSINQFSYGFPLGGMNEHGLAVEELSSVAWGNNSEENPAINEFQWIQFQLDMFKTVQEVIDGLSEYRIMSFVTPVHYLLCDKTSDSAIIEIIKGKVKVYHGYNLPYKVLSNNAYSESIRYLGNFCGFGGNMQPKFSLGSNDRFVTACHLLGNLKGSEPLDIVVKIMARVRQGDTQWTIIYDTGKSEVLIRLAGGEEFKRIILKEAMFQERGQPYYLDLEQMKTKNHVKIKFTPLTNDVCNKIVREIILEFDEKAILEEKSLVFLQQILKW